MNQEFLAEMYEQTREFQEWKRRDKYENFTEAESAFFDKIDEAKSKGMNHIGRGGERDVYSGGSVAGQDNVVKIARTGLRQNENAVNMWNEIPDDAKKYVADIVEWGDGFEWLVQKRASGRGETEKVAKNLAQFSVVTPDLNGQNVGVYQDTSVLIDLGEAQYL